MRRRVVVSLVEDGWRSARVLSLALARDLHLQVCHYIKGRMRKDVARMITPHQGVALRAVDRRWFKVYAALAVLAHVAGRRCRLIIVDNPRAARWVTRLAQWRRVPVIEAREDYQRLSYIWDEDVLSRDIVIEQMRVLQYAHRRPV